MDVRNRLRADARSSACYERAVVIFNEKREILRRLSELHLELRGLTEQDADAVTAARMDVPFRHPAGRPKRVHTASK